MLKRLFQKLNKQRGSATIEAAIAFTGFLFVIFTILSLVNLCRAQMLVSSAMDTAAKELSQYAYFYKMSGLQKFKGVLDDKAEAGREEINEVIGTVDTLYSTMVEAVDGTISDYTNIAEATASGSLDLSDFTTAYGNLESNGDAINSGINEMTEKFEAVGSNPMLYMKSLVAIAGSSGMETAMSHLIAAPLAKLFVRQHFGDSAEEADAALERLGIVDGLDGMNFKMSQIFTADREEDIQLVVFYKVRLVQLFDWEILEMNVCKRSICRAWLAGDDPQAEINTETDDGSEAGSGSGNGNSSDAEGSAESTDETSAQEGTEPSQTTEATESTTVASTGNWAMQHDPSGYYHSERVETFTKQFYVDYGLDNLGSPFSYPSSSEATTAYVCDVYAKWNYEPYETMGGTTRDPGVELLETSIKYSIDNMSEREYTNNNGQTQTFSGIQKVIYVPENMPEDQYQSLLAAAQRTEASMEAYAATLDGAPENLDVTIVIIRGGGTYDYSSSESDYVHIGEDAS